MPNTSGIRHVSSLTKRLRLKKKLFTNFTKIENKLKIFFQKFTGKLTIQ